MQSISITYTIKYFIDFAPNYGWTNDNKCFNLKTNRQIKQVYNNGCIGYSIKGKVYSLHKLRNHLVKVVKCNLPF